MAKQTLVILRCTLQDFYSMFDHFQHCMWKGSGATFALEGYRFESLCTFGVVTKPIYDAPYGLQVVFETKTQ